MKNKQGTKSRENNRKKLNTRTTKTDVSNNDRQKAERTAKQESRERSRERNGRASKTEGTSNNAAPSRQPRIYVFAQIEKSSPSEKLKTGAWYSPELKAGEKVRGRHHMAFELMVGALRYCEAKGISPMLILEDSTFVEMEKYRNGTNAKATKLLKTFLALMRTTSGDVRSLSRLEALGRWEASLWRR